MSSDHRSPEEFAKAAEDFWRKLGDSPAGVFLTIVVILLFFAVPNAFYTVQPEEEAVVTFFGRYDRTTSPGLHFKIPFVEQATRIKTKTIFEEAFGTYSSSESESPQARGFLLGALENRRGGRSRGRRLDEESLMLTGDLNVADVKWVVQYQIMDPKKFLFNTAQPIQNIRDISQAAMRRVVGDRSVDSVIRGQDISSAARNVTQEVLDKYDMGVKVTSVQVKAAFPPESVKPSFNEVNAAKQEQEQAINEAEAYYNEIIPKARGEADKEISEARGRAAALVNEAKGDVQKFEKLLTEYVKAPDITKRRLYLETMEELLGRFQEVTIVDPQIKGVLPLYAGTPLPPKNTLK
ncbi:MAG: FtsH protease activity modulator HflK [Bdellovibrionales bacterium]|nr:FtsH protease activity modulator HflK [Bdellovibrionales bacterium]